MRAQIPLDQTQTDAERAAEWLAKITVLRMRVNTQETGHPLHHRTAFGTIVDRDRTLEQFLQRLAELALPAIPCE